MNLSDEPRLLAQEVLARVERHNAYASIAFDAVAMSGNLSREVRALSKELLFGVLRHRTRLERAVSEYANSSLDHCHPFVRRQLLIGAYQILFMQNIPPAIAVDRAVELTRLHVGTTPSGFVNAVLRKLSHQGEPPFSDTEEPLARLGTVHSFAPWMVQAAVDTVGLEEAGTLLDALNQRARTILRTNVLRTDRPGLIARLVQHFPDASVVPCRLSPIGVEVQGLPDPIRQDLHREGWYLVQDEGSQLVVFYVDPRPGSRILDACAGTGGKSLHLGARLANQAEILAVDLKASKMDALLARARRAGVTCVSTSTMNLIKEQPAGLFDLVLLDAPCSGLGVLRRHPEAKWRLTQEEARSMVRRQAQLLEAMAAKVAPGGQLAYVVCTFWPPETTEQIAAFLALHPEFSRLGPPPEAEVPWGDCVNAQGDLVLLPHRHNTDGFYVARLVRKG
jgi:16S rRNA (cytosine967-C5)-methyltransferase